MRYAQFERFILLVMSVAILAMAVAMVVQKTDGVEVLGHALMLVVIVASLYRGRGGALLSFAVCLAIYVVFRLVWRGDLTPGVLAELVGGKFLFYGVLALLCTHIRVQFRYFFVKMEQQDLLDDETQLGNERFLLREITRQIQEHDRYRNPFSLVMFSFDPTLISSSREKGGSVLRDVSVNVLKRNTRSVDELAREGDQLVVLLPHVGPEGARSCASRLQERMRDLLSSRGWVYESGLKTTVLAYPEDREEIEAYLARLKEKQAPLV